MLVKFCKVSFKTTSLQFDSWLLVLRGPATVLWNPSYSMASEVQAGWLDVAAAAKSLQSCPTLCDPIDGSPPDSPVPGILQARALEWVAISFSNAWKWKWSLSILSNSFWPHGLQPIRLLHQWLGVTRGHFLFPEFICLKSVLTSSQKMIGPSPIGMRMKGRPGEKHLWFLDKSVWYLEDLSSFSFKLPPASFCSLSVSLE